MPAIRNSEVLKTALLEVLSQHPDGLPIQSAYDLVASTYQFPEDWYRQIPTSIGYDELTKLGYPDWQQVPQEKLIALVSTEPKWQNEMRWSRNTLRKEGLLDTTTPRGVWRLTELGIYTAKNKLLNGLNPDEQRIVKTRRPISPKPSVQTSVLSGHAPATVRETLEQKLKILTSSMPLDDLELLIELARVVRIRSITGAVE